MLFFLSEYAGERRPFNFILAECRIYFDRFLSEKRYATGSLHEFLQKQHEISGVYTQDIIT